MGLKKAHGLNKLVLSLAAIGLLVGAPLSGYAKAKKAVAHTNRDPREMPEVFKAQEEDGTPKTMKAHTDADNHQAVEEFMPAPAAISPQEDDSVGMISDEETVESAPTAIAELKRRIEALEEARAEVKSQAATVTVEVPAAAAPKATEKKLTKFDDVPEKHIPDLARRLKYTNEILKRFGRAYDYRVTTINEFKRIVAELEKNQESEEK